MARESGGGASRIHWRPCRVFGVSDPEFRCILFRGSLDHTAIAVAQFVRNRLRRLPDHHADLFGALVGVAPDRRGGRQNPDRVASRLLTQMTGGQRNSIDIDEDFNIKVDAQDLDELSGSAKAVANLSIRLGLGQVLTNRVFSVFLGDELDAAMDIDRAGFTAECLRNLTGKIKQVVLVKHKRPDADHFIA
jgi:hypothetical protein